MQVTQLTLGSMIKNAKAEHDMATRRGNDALADPIMHEVARDHFAVADHWWSEYRRLKEELKALQAKQKE